MLSLYIIHVLWGNVLTGHVVHDTMCIGLLKLAAYMEALWHHPPVAASCTTPQGGSGDYKQELLDVYRMYVAERKAATENS